MDDPSYLPEYSFSRREEVNEEDSDRTSSDMNSNCIERESKLAFFHQF